VQQPEIYMNTLLVMHAVNITLSLLLIVGWPAVVGRCRLTPS